MKIESNSVAKPLDATHIINQYGADNIEVPESFVPWMRSNHAGETGAVWIYKGAACAFWSKAIREMAREHGQTEKHHLMVMEHLLTPSKRSKLIFLWKLMGMGLGLLPSLFGYRVFCLTIKAVETFVEEHYQEQIGYLQRSSEHPKLLGVLKKCCEEEVHHQQDAHKRTGGGAPGQLGSIWVNTVGAGSALAVKAAKII
ncbi:MAG: ubiquinone biosynthesis monooxygenase Coq7 [Cellvibrionaceae bacterium]|jgi:ubiquinone biosynthesis monooxygenase Coq7